MNIKRAKEEIKNTVKAYLLKDVHGDYVIPAIRQRPILLMGPPGIGKTQIMQQIAGECGIGLVSYTITHHTRQSAVGLPFIREEEYQGKGYSVTEYTMSEIISSIYRYIKETGRKEGILFIDEINCVSETLAPTMLQFLQCKTFGNQAVPEGWIIVTAGNPPEYNKSVRDFDFVTLDRIRRMDIEADLAVFKEYARNHRIHPFILSYLELRPRNFYRTEKDVDGLRFVTARGWEDLSYLIKTYEDQGIRLDEAVIRQYLQHEDVARDAATYYDLYQKYREEYDISTILSGRVKTEVYQRLFAATFDERLSCVELLSDGVIRRILEAMEEDRVTEECFAFLRSYRETLAGDLQEEREQAAVGINDGAGKPTGKESPRNIYERALRNREEALKLREGAGLLTPEEKSHFRTVNSLLRRWMPMETRDAGKAFQEVKERASLQVEKREETVSRASEALENAFSFMENAFGEGQEMVVFVTELAMNEKAVEFITENGSEKYFKYNKTLLIGTRRAEILQEMRRDEIYSSAAEYEF